MIYIDPKVIAYFILSIGIVAYGTNMLLPSGPGRAILFAIGSILLFIFFGFRWFSSSSTTTTKTWPPTINTCPDYLTFVPSAASGANTILNTSTFPANSSAKTNGGCVDYLGVSTNGTLGRSTTSTTQLTYSGGTTYVSGNIFPYTSKDVKPATMTDICTACQTAGITWEGVYDGDSCVGGAAAAKANAAAGGCPAS